MGDCKTVVVVGLQGTPHHRHHYHRRPVERQQQLEAFLLASFSTTGVNVGNCLFKNFIFSQTEDHPVQSIFPLPNRHLVFYRVGLSSKGIDQTSLASPLQDFCGCCCCSSCRVFC